MASVTYREYEIWMEYFDLEGSSPSRSDHYLMQLTREVVVKDVKRSDAARVTIGDFKLEFSSKPTQQQPTLSVEEYQAQIDKSLMMYKMGLTYDGKPLKNHKKMVG